MNNNILFLDIDGVLNSSATAVAYGDSLPKPGQTRWSEVSLKLIEKLCKKFNLKIYFHSTWVYHVDDDFFRDEFKRYGIDVEILDREKTAKKLSETRADRIFRGISLYQPEKFIIIDDDYGLRKWWPDCFICTEFEYGFGFKEYSEVMKYFGERKEITIL